MFFFYFLIFIFYIIILKRFKNKKLIFLKYKNSPVLLVLDSHQTFSLFITPDHRMWFSYPPSFCSKVTRYALVGSCLLKLSENLHNGPKTCHNKEKKVRNLHWKIPGFAARRRQYCKIIQGLKWWNSRVFKIVFNRAKHLHSTLLWSPWHASLRYASIHKTCMILLGVSLILAKSDKVKRAAAPLWHKREKE
jgi:hypothetical protein